MGRLRRYECECKHRFELFEWRGELMSQDRLDNPEDISCPKCGGEERREVGSDIGRLRHLEGESKFYPHFNRGLQMEIRSEAHLKQVMDEQGLVPWSEIADGENFDLRANAEKRAHREREGAKRYRATQERYKTDPELREAYYKLKEQGAYRTIGGK